jgi:multiple sugar transport system substrate-binding protein
MSSAPADRSSVSARGGDMEQRLSRRDFLRLTSGLAAGAGLAACSPRPRGRGPHGNEVVQLVYQDWRTPWFPGLAQEMLARFHSEQPGIRVFYTPDPENFDEQMLADFQAGTASDVLAGCCDHLPSWAQSGYVLDLAPFVAADLDQATIADWDKAQYEALFTADGRQFGLPKYHGALALIYNKDHFDSLGVDYPDGSWDFDDYGAAQSRLTTEASPGRPAVFGSMLDVSWDRIQIYVNAWGGHFVDPESPARCLMGADEAIAAVGWLKDRMWTDHTMASPLDVNNLSTREAFAAGRLAMVEEGSWALRDILETANFRIGVAPFPHGPARRVTLATTDGFAIFSGTQHPEAAWELVKFLIGPEYGLAMARSHFLQPARASLVRDWVRLIQSQFPTETNEMDLEVFAEGHLEGYSVTAEIFPNMSAARTLAAEAWQKILVLGQDPVESLREVAAAIEEAQTDHS